MQRDDNPAVSWLFWHYRRSALCSNVHQNGLCVYRCSLTTTATLFRGGARSKTVNADDQVQSVMLEMHVKFWHRLALWQVEKFCFIRSAQWWDAFWPYQGCLFTLLPRHLQTAIQQTSHINSLPHLGQLKLLHAAHKAQHQIVAQRFFFRSIDSVPIVTVFVVFLTRTQDIGNLTAGLTAVASTPRVERLETADKSVANCSYFVLCFNCTLTANWL